MNKEESYEAKYTTIKQLGEGTYGKVYEGVDNETKTKIAIKHIDLNIKEFSIEEQKKLNVNKNTFFKKSK